MMTIKELEEAVGMTRANIRFYEQEGLLSPARSANGYRDYSPEDAAALEKIKLLRRLHLDLNTLRRLQAGELTLAEALEKQLGPGPGPGSLRPASGSRNGISAAGRPPLAGGTGPGPGLGAVRSPRR